MANHFSTNLLEEHEDYIKSLNGKVCINCKHFDKEDVEDVDVWKELYPDTTFGDCMCEDGNYYMETCEGELFSCEDFSAKEPAKN